MVIEREDSENSGEGNRGESHRTTLLRQTPRREADRAAWLALVRLVALASVARRSGVEATDGPFKRELTHHKSYVTREEARRSLFEYIKVFYNRQRLHSTLGYRSPADYELRFAS